MCPLPQSPAWELQLVNLLTFIILPSLSSADKFQIQSNLLSKYFVEIFTFVFYKLSTVVCVTDNSTKKSNIITDVDDKRLDVDVTLKAVQCPLGRVTLLWGIPLLLSDIPSSANLFVRLEANQIPMLHIRKA